MDKGIYSDIEHASHLEICAKKYPNAVVTMDSAFYHYGLTDTIPNCSYLATDRDASKIRDEKVKQSFLPKEVLKLGVVMRSMTGNSRRTTQDLDIDFIRYSLSDESIDMFLDKINCLEDMEIVRFGKIIKGR